MIKHKFLFTIILFKWDYWISSIQYIFFFTNLTHVHMLNLKIIIKHKFSHIIRTIRKVLKNTNMYVFIYINKIYTIMIKLFDYIKILTFQIKAFYFITIS